MSGIASPPAGHTSFTVLLTSTPSPRETPSLSISASNALSHGSSASGAHTSCPSSTNRSSQKRSSVNRSRVAPHAPPSGNAAFTEPSGSPCSVPRSNWNGAPSGSTVVPGARCSHVTIGKAAAKRACSASLMQGHSTLLKKFFMSMSATTTGGIAPLLAASSTVALQWARASAPPGSDTPHCLISTKVGSKAFSCRRNSRFAAVARSTSPTLMGRGAFPAFFSK